jgi:hypothetical protein
MSREESLFDVTRSSVVIPLALTQEGNPAAFQAGVRDLLLPS